MRWTTPLRLQILFAGGTTLRLRGSGDGEGLIIDRLPLEQPMDMGEYGRTDVFDFTDHLDAALAVEEVGQPHAIRNPEGKLIELALPRLRGDPFCIWVNGDEFRWGSEAALSDDYWPDGWAPTVNGPL